MAGATNGVGEITVGCCAVTVELGATVTVDNVGTMVMVGYLSPYPQLKD